MDAEPTVYERALAHIRAKLAQGVDDEYPWECRRCGAALRDQWITCRKSRLVDRTGRSSCFGKRTKHKT